MKNIEINFIPGLYIKTDDGRIGYIEEICTCNWCKQRGFCEPMVRYEDGDYDYITVYEKEHGFIGYKQIGNVMLHE